jgi:hypothetical protein
MTLKTNVSCFNPDCSNLITIPLEQKRELFLEDFLKYGKFSLPYCSKRCQELHQEELKKAKFLTAGTLKNHESALIVYGADTTKRFKEGEIKRITGNKTEQRAKALRDKLLSMKVRDGRRYLTSVEVHDFLKTELPDDLKIKWAGGRPATHDVMKKTKSLFPKDISINSTEKNYQEIEFI